MIEFEVKSRKLNIGTRAGQTVYYAAPKTQQKFTNKMRSTSILFVNFWLVFG